MIRRALLALSVLSLTVGCTPDSAGSAAVMRVPREVADVDALARLSDWAGLPTFGGGVYRMQSSEDRKTGWKPPISLWSNDNRDFNNFICRGQDTDAAPSNVPHVVDLDACPEPYVRGMVMARFEGSGRLVRIWMTAASIRNAAADDEVVRIYVDDEERPTLQAPLAEMLGGGGHEIFAPPFGAGSRRYLAWHYPVVFNDKLIVSIDGLGQKDLYFHQTSVVLDEVEGPRKSAPRRLAERTRAKQFLTSRVPMAGSAHHTSLSLEANRATEIVLTGPATIVKTTLTMAAGASVSRVRVRVFWDDETKPAIDAPLADLFGYISSSHQPPSSLALASTRRGDRVLTTLRLPMPFAKRARWQFDNGGEAIELAMTHEIVPGVPTQKWGHLHMQRNVTSGKAESKVHPLAKASGRGRLVGTCIAMRGHGLVERGRAGHPFHFLEGDELGFIDGERVLAGTGTEDYFDSAFYFEGGPSGTPFAQAWDVTPRLREAPKQGSVSTCRWHVLGDEIDFRRSLDLNLEIGPGVPGVLDEFRSVTYLYQ